MSRPSLKELFRIFGKIDWRKSSEKTPVLGVTSDSRKVQAGFVFVAVKGVTSDGHDFLESAIQSGAQALVVESPRKVPDSFQGAVLEVLDSALAYAQLLSLYHQRPEEKLIAIGVTGTNGKTSTTYMVEALLNGAQVPCGVMGTIDHHFQDQVWDSQLTTPDAATFFSRLEEFVRHGAKAFVMEVSSHSLKQKRVPIQFDLALFTNFTRDHLDYHGSMEDYLESKRLLFTHHLKQEGDVFAVLNAEDRAVAETPVLSTAQNWKFGRTPDSDFRFEILSSDLSGSRFVVHEGKSSTEYETSMVGEHNVQNWVGAIALARALGIPSSTLQSSVKNFSGVPGRMQRVLDSKGRHLFVDYAHTPDALEKILQSVKALRQSNNRILLVFGCGGDRDKGKRPMMAQVAEQFADEIIITSDNPRSEDPLQILKDIQSGLKNKNVHLEVDRKKAMKLALQKARPGDVVLVAGKGHERGQTIGTQTLPFQDVEVLQALIKESQP